MKHRLKWKSKLTGVESVGDWTNDKNKLEQQKEFEHAFMLGTIEYNIESKEDSHTASLNRVKRRLGL